MKPPREYTVHGLVVALGATVAIAMVPEPAPPPPPRQDGAVALDAAWPEATVTDLSGNLADGAPFTPLEFLDDRTPIGITQDAASVRLLIRWPDAPPTVVRTLPVTESPRVIGLTRVPDGLVWLEMSSADAPGTGRLWRSGPRGEDPVLVTADTGTLVVNESRYDLVVHDGTACWAAGVPDGTEVRCVAVTGGPVSAGTTLPGPYALTVWPWAREAAVEKLGTTRMVNLVTKQVTEVPGQAVEVIDCTPAWCQVRVLRQGGLVRIDLMRPDGRDRHQVRSTQPALTDPVLLDRFVPVLRTGPDGAGVLSVHDTTTRRLVDLATGPGVVHATDTRLWWSTGGNDALTWHSLTLADLP